MQNPEPPEPEEGPTEEVAPRKRRRFEDAPPDTETTKEQDEANATSTQTSAQPVKKWDMFAEADNFGHQFHVSLLFTLILYLCVVKHFHHFP
jgi:hypothetical protein